MSDEWVTFVSFVVVGLLALGLAALLEHFDRAPLVRSIVGTQGMVLVFMAPWVAF